MENLRLGVSAVRHDMKREETVEKVEMNTEWQRRTPKTNNNPLNIRGFQWAIIFADSVLKSDTPNSKVKYN